ncbi:hypothetical protein KSF_049600 [Reticulibacter mediterranei]|uniref:Uncharacterized protein n=1 Tax=Reticulibacter mediterranei TaxID=2778369 RepID=A0A8J3N216_9CHLR|nr:hypothetical protein KSF_049600 [Reticulibacter mediterranei]
MGCLLAFFLVYSLIGNLRVAFIQKDRRILRHLRGDPMALSDRIERTMLLPVPRPRVWDAVTKLEQLARRFGVS